MTNVWTHDAWKRARDMAKDRLGKTRANIEALKHDLRPREGDDAIMRAMKKQSANKFDDELFVIDWLECLIERDEQK